jgi:hypothetical protein
MDTKSENCAPLAINFVYSRFKKKPTTTNHQSKQEVQIITKRKTHCPFLFFKKKGSDVCHYYQSPDTLKKM